MRKRTRAATLCRGFWISRRAWMMLMNQTSRKREMIRMVRQLKSKVNYLYAWFLQTISLKTCPPSTQNDSIERPLESHPTIATSLINIMRMPTKDDYLLWRVHCKVNLFVAIAYYIFYPNFFVCLAWIERGGCIFLVSDHKTTPRGAICIRIWLSKGLRVY